MILRINKVQAILCFSLSLFLNLGVFEISQNIRKNLCTKICTWKLEIIRRNATFPADSSNDSVEKYEDYFTGRYFKVTDLLISYLEKKSLFPMRADSYFCF
jgi:hypothetical protein